MRWAHPFCRWVALALMLAAGGCTAPRPQVGPPPTPEEPTSVVADTSSQPPAPVLPDPRPNLPPLPPLEAEVASEATSRVAEHTGEAPHGGPMEAIYSVQVAAFSSEAHARELARQVREQIAESAEVVQEDDGMWRIYVGRERDRASADRLRERLRAAGFSESWTKARLVPAAETRAAPPAGEPVYSVQVFASSSRENAQRVAEEVKAVTDMPVEVVQMGAYWKVFVGRSATREAIDAERDRLRRSGYPDAWTCRREAQ